MDFKIFENYEVEGQISMFECEKEKSEQEIRNKAIDELKQRFRTEFEEMMALDMEDCINWADWLDGMAEKMKGEQICQV